jgi:hypothetical protein
MKPARSILPAVDQTIEEANGRREARVARAVGHTVAANGGETAAQAARPTRAGAAQPDRSVEFRPPGDALLAGQRGAVTSAPPPKASARDRKMATATLIRISSLATLSTTFGIVASGPIAASDQRPGATSSPPWRFPRAARSRWPE